MSSSMNLQSKPLRTVLRDDADGKESWRLTCSRVYGQQCEFFDGRAEGSVVSSWDLGQLDLLDIELAHQSLAPVAESSLDHPSEHHLFLKLVKAGSMVLEQKGQMRRFQAGGLVVVDSAKPYRQSFSQITQVVAVRIPKYALRERGFRHELRAPITPDTAAPDVQAISGLILSMAQQAGATSKLMRRRQGGQLLDLIDILLDDPAVLVRARSGNATLYRAKRYIAQNLRNAELTATHVASAASASEAHLHRLFRAEGTSLMRYVWSCRLELAERILRGPQEGQVQIQEVAYNCGFSSAAHFSRAFKDRYGVSPRDAVTADLIVDRFDQ